MSETWICPVCEKIYRLKHKENGTHGFYEVPKKEIDGKMVWLLIPDLCVVKHKPKKKQLEEFAEK